MKKPDCESRVGVEKHNRLTWPSVCSGVAWWDSPNNFFVAATTLHLPTGSSSVSFVARVFNGRATYNYMCEVIPERSHIHAHIVLTELLSAQILPNIFAYILERSHMPAHIAPTVLPTPHLSRIIHLYITVVWNSLPYPQHNHNNNGIFWHLGLDTKPS